MTDAGHDPLLPGSPGLPDLRFRTYRGDDDIPAISELLRASFAANGETISVDPEELRSEFRDSLTAAPSEDMVLGFVGDRLVARSFIEWADTRDGTARYYESWGDVHPEWRRRGIGTVVWERNIRRLTTLAQEQGFDSQRFLTLPCTSVTGS